MSSKASIVRAAHAIKDAKALLITAGAGLGVDSGLPDFRGPEGLWKAYPPLKERNLTLPETSTPHWFKTDPHFAWGFFGHRMNLYRSTTPHQGFQILKKWASKMELGYFVFTSNVDGHFQKAGFPDDKVVECHGSINFLQTTHKFDDIWPVADDFSIDICDPTLTAMDPLPCGPPGFPEEQQILARPNVLMFSDFSWVSKRTDEQESRLGKWLHEVRGNKILVIEIGSSSFVPTVRNFGENVIHSSQNKDSCLMRINPRDYAVTGKNDISIPMNGLEALLELDKLLE